MFQAMAIVERFEEATVNAFTTFLGTLPAACRNQAIVISALEISHERSKD